MAIKNVVFDIGAVLLNWQPYQLLESVFPKQSKQLYKQIIGHPQWLQLDAGLQEEDKAIIDFANRTGKSIADIKLFMQALRNHLKPIDDSVKILEDVKKLGYKLYVLSNMPKYLMNHYLSRDNFWHKFDGIVYSAQEHLLKPDKAIFKVLFDRYGINPDESVFIDDTKINIDSAKLLGMQGIVFKNPMQCREALIDMNVL